MQSRNWLAAIIAAFILAACAQSAIAQQFTNAPRTISETIPSAATGAYVGGGWSCTITAYAVPRQTSIALPSGGAPTVEWVCTDPSGVAYFGNVASADGLNCPQRGWSGYLLSYVQPWGPRGELSLVGYDGASPGTLYVEARLYPAALPVPLTLTRTVAVPSPRPYSCGVERIKR